MNCADFELDIADTLAGSANPAALARATAHLAECTSCRATAALWAQLSSLPAASAGPGLRSGFDRRLAVRTVARRWRWMAVAAALLIGLGSFLAGRISRPAEGNGDLAGLRREVRNLREVVALSLLEQQSASERLRGVRYSAALEGTDPEVVDALARTLRSDPSVNVRLAAADALRRFSLPDSVRESAWALLDRDESPLVQIAVIDLLAGSRDPGLRTRLERLRGRAGLDGDVRDYLQALLANPRTKGNPFQ